MSELDDLRDLARTFFAREVAPRHDEFVAHRPQPLGGRAPNRPRERGHGGGTDRI